jgi:group II intron reverse transcriptase/maturase
MLEMEGSTEAIVMRKRGPRTPEEKVRELQDKLHLSAKREPARRFHQLYDKVASPWFLRVAWGRVRRNKGAAGPDGVTIQMIETLGVDAFLDGLSRKLRARACKAGPVRRVYIPKANGKMRPLGIPNVCDRVVQASAVLILEPIFEADLPETAYGFRPGRNAHQAMARVSEHLLKGRTEVVDADLSSYFDTIPHHNLLRLVAKRVVDRGVLNLIKQWLRAPVIEPDDPPGSSGKRSDRGTPQGGVISPLLANIYHACIPYLWNARGHARRLGGEIVSYADDFVIMLGPGRGKAALQVLHSICERLSLRLNEEKTRVVDALADSFRFLGFSVQKVRNPKSGKWYPRVTPAPKSEQRVRDRLREITDRKRGGKAAGAIIAEMSSVLRGWGAYFHHGHPQQSMTRINYFAAQRLRKWLMRRRQRRGPGYSQYPARRLYGEMGLYRLPMARPPAPAHA